MDLVTPATQRIRIMREVLSMLDVPGSSGQRVDFSSWSAVRRLMLGEQATHRSQVTPRSGAFREAQSPDLDLSSRRAGRVEAARGRRHPRARCGGDALPRDKHVVTTT
jgi:hypothetical protein